MNPWGRLVSCPDHSRDSYDGCFQGLNTGVVFVVTSRQMYYTCKILTITCLWCEVDFRAVLPPPFPQFGEDVHDGGVMVEGLFVPQEDR